MNIDRRRNDTVRKGHYPALGRGFCARHRGAAADVAADRRVGSSSFWAKRTRPAACCEVCPPLFPLTRCAQGGVTVVTDRPCSRQQASDWIRWAVAQAGSDSTRFSGISARKGGISAAIEARVDEAIMYLQSGHGQALPARAYIYLTSPARFLDTFEAFGL